MPDEWGVIVYAMNAMREVLQREGIPARQVGRAMGKGDNYVARIANRGSVPRCDTMARMLDVCGYSLVALPSAYVPKDAIVIDGDSEADKGDSAK